MTDLFAYHAAKQQMTDLRRTAGQLRLAATSSTPRVLRNSRQLIASMLTRVSAPRSSDQPEAGLASHTTPARPDA